MKSRHAPGSDDSDALNAAIERLRVGSLGQQTPGSPPSYVSLYAEHCNALLRLLEDALGAAASERERGIREATSKVKGEASIDFAEEIRGRTPDATLGYDTDRIRRHVMSNDEADAVADAVEAGRALARTWFAFGQWCEPHIPDAVALREALRRLGEDQV